MAPGTTHCYWCEREMPIGAGVCPNCAKPQVGGGKPNPLQPKMLLAVVLAVVVLIGWNWFKP